MKKYLYAILLLGIIFSACDREYEEDIISTTPPELHIVVTNSDGTAASGATINIYKSVEDFNNQNSAFLTKNTDGEGLAVVTGEELGNPGVYYVVAEKDGNSLGKETPYLLLNDGQTRFEIQFE